MARMQGITLVKKLIGHYLEVTQLIFSPFTIKMGKVLAEVD